MKSKKKLSFQKMNIAQLGAIQGGNLGPTEITARNSVHPTRCDDKSGRPECQITARQTLFGCP